MNSRLVGRAWIPESRKRNSGPGSKKTNISRFENSPFDRILSLQRTAGNQAVQRLITSCALQTKATSGHSSKVDPNLEPQIQSLKGGGHPLSENDSTFFETHFGRDFSQVVLHTDTRAGEIARKIHARAFTIGRHLVLGAGEYAPETTKGRKLLAHELTHIVQQKSTNSQIQRHRNHSGLTADEKYTHTLDHAGTDQESWDANLVDNADFLGVPIARGIHQELANRLTIAETYLREQHGGLSEADIATRIGLYSISGLRRPARAVGGSKISNHAFGIAIDVNYRGNPYVGRSEEVDEIISRATELMLGREFHIRVRQRGTLEEIRSRFEETSNALRDYFNLRDNREQLVVQLRTRGLPTDEADVQQRIEQINNDYTSQALRDDFATTDPANPRDPAAGFIDLSRELVEALGNQAGLYWGGQYETGKDIMHFDWRRGTIRSRHRV